MNHHGKFSKRHMARWMLLLLMAALALLPSAPAFAAIDPNATALQIAQAIAANPAIVTSASFVTRAGAAGTNSSAASADSAVGGFPINGSTYGILSSGRANQLISGTPDPGTDLGGGNIRGTSDFDVTILQVNLNVPSGVNCLSFDFRFYTAEFPEYVGQEFNDAFIAELGSSTWTTTSNSIIAPNNFAFDPANKPISVNASGFTSLSNANAAGTAFAAEDGATPFLTARTPITPGAQTVYFSIFDQADRILDSTILIDNLAVTNVSGGCSSGTVQPQPNLTKAFSPTAVRVGDTSTATFTINNVPGNPAQSGISFTDTLPGAGGIIFTGTPSTTCSAGSVSIGGGGTELTFSGGALNAGTASCTVTATVQGVNTGSYTNDSTRFSSVANLNVGSANAVLTIQGNASLTKAFGTSPILVGNTTTLTFTLTNGFGNPPQSGLGFTDTLPTGITFTGTPSTTCPSGSVVLGGGNQSLTFSGAMNDGQASCTVTATVSGDTAGSFPNTNASNISGVTGGLITTGVNATLVVNPAPALLTKAFSPTTIFVTQGSTVTFTLTNASGNPAQTGIGFRDTLPNNNLRWDPAFTETTDCGSGAITATVGGTNNRQLDISGVSMTAGQATCTIIARAIGFGAATVTNGAAQVTNLSQVDDSGVNASITIQALPNVTLTKDFSPNTVNVGETFTATFTLSNSTAGAPARTGLGFTETLPGASSNGSLRFVSVDSNTCGATTTITGTKNTQLVVSGASVGAAPSSCVITATVRSFVGGSFTNNSSNITGTTGVSHSGSTTVTVNDTRAELTKVFSPSAIDAGLTSTMRFTVTVPSGRPTLVDGAFAETLPTNVTVVALASNTCIGSNANFTPTSVDISNVDLVTGTSCVIEYTVTSSTPGVYVNDETRITSSSGINEYTMNATLTVYGPTATLTKAFSPTTITAGSTSTLTFTITNGAQNGPKPNMTFRETLPGSGNIRFTGTPTSTCTSPTITISGANNEVLNFIGSLNAGTASCTVTATVQGVISGVYLNNNARIDNLSANLVSNVNATLTVNEANATLTKTFTPATINVGQVTTLTFTITNGFGNEQKSGLAFTESLPGSGGITFSSAPTTNCTNATVATPDSTTLTFAGELADGQADCTITIEVTGNARNTYVNNSGRISGLGGGLVNNVDATLTVNEPRPALTKVYSPTSIPVTQTSTLTFTITNGDGLGSQSNLGFTDTLPSGIVFTGTPTTTCDNGVVSLGGGGQTLTLAGGTLNAGQTTCTVTATVQGNSTGTYPNTSAEISGVTGNLLISGVNATLTVIPQATLSKAYSTSPIAVGATSTLTFTLTNGTGNPAQSGLGFRDTLPGSGNFLIFTGTPSSTCPGANMSITNNGTEFNFSGNMNNGQATCTITVLVEGGLIGTYPNTSAEISHVTGGLILNVNATLEVADPRPAMTKVFSPNPVIVGNESVLTFTITNGTGLPAQSNLGFRDTLPGSGGARYVAMTTNTCGGSATIGGTNDVRFDYSGGSMAAGQTTCTISVRVLGFAEGSYLNDNRRITNVTGGLITRNINDTLVVNPAPLLVTITKSYNRPVIGTGGRSTLSLRLNNASGNPAQSGLNFTDTFNVNVTVAEAPVSPQCGATITAASNVLTVTGASLSAGQANCTIVVPVTSTVPGVYPNNSSNFSNLAGIDASTANATLTVTAQATLYKGFEPIEINPGENSTLAFTLFNAPYNPEITGIGFTDTLPDGLTVVGTPTSPQCGGTVSVSGGNVITVSGATLNFGAGWCQIFVTVTGNTPGVYWNDFTRISNPTKIITGTVNGVLVIRGPSFAAYPYPNVFVSGHANRPIKAPVAVGNFGAPGTTLTMQLVSNSNPSVFSLTGLPLNAAQGGTPPRFSVGCTPRPGQVFTGTLVLSSNEPGNPTYTFNLYCLPAAETIGLWRPSNGLWAFRLTNTSGVADRATFHGQPGDLPVTGDWDGDGVETVGVFRNGTFLLKNENNDGAGVAYTISFGAAGDLPVAGDWDNDGIETIGVFRPSTGAFYLRNSLTDGAPDFIMSFGQAGDKPLVGDWNGNGSDTVGIFRPSEARFFLLSEVCANCIPNVDASVWYGLPNNTDLPVVGDWNGDGITGIGVFRTTNGIYYLKYNPLEGGVADTFAEFGLLTDLPFGGYWEQITALSDGPAQTGSGNGTSGEGGSAPIFVPRN
ncbi:MAG: hypothetical protein OHK0023_27650 [Anaerolineae bacterium]